MRDVGKMASRATALAACVGLALLCSLPQRTAAKSTTETFTATAVDVGNVLGGRSMSITIRVFRYATEEETQRLEAAFSDGGSEALLRALEKIKKMGSVAVDGQVSYDVGAVWNIPTEKGRRIVIVTARPISAFEARNATRSRDYPFSVLQMDLDNRGKGEGTAIPAAKIRPNKSGGVTIENFATYELRLIGVRKR